MQSSQGFPASNCVFSASAVDYGTDSKRGGVLQLAVRSLATRTTDTHSDNYGRFPSQTFTGCAGISLTVISAYRVGETSQGPASAFAQQRVMLAEKNRPAKPRAMFIEDLTAYIQDCQLKGHDIILCLDANETLEKPNSGLRRLTTTCSLIDVHEHFHPRMALPSHQRGSGKIDFMMVSPRIISCITRAGILPINSAFASDHRLMYIDLDIHKCFKGLTTDPVSSRTRNFTSKNTKRSNIFRKAITAEWEHRQLSRRIKIVSDLADKQSPRINPKRLQRLWDKVDTEIGYALSQADRALCTPT